MRNGRAGPQRRSTLHRAPFGDVPGQRIVRRGLVGHHVGGESAPEQLRHHRGYPADSGWLWIFHQAKLDLHDLSEELPTNWERIPEVAQKTFQIYEKLIATKQKLATLGI